MENDKARTLMLDLYAWARINVFCAGILFLVGWGIGIYKVDINTYSTTTAEEMLSWEMSREIEPKTSRK